MKTPNRLAILVTLVLLAGCGSQSDPSKLQRAMVQAPVTAPVIPAGSGKDGMFKYGGVRPGMNPHPTTIPLGGGLKQGN